MITIAQYRILREIFLKDPYFQRLQIPINTAEIFGKDYGQGTQLGEKAMTVEQWAESNDNLDEVMPEVTITARISKDPVVFNRFVETWQRISQEKFKKHISVPASILPKS